MNTPTRRQIRQEILRAKAQVWMERYFILEMAGQFAKAERAYDKWQEVERDYLRSLLQPRRVLQSA